MKLLLALLCVIELLLGTYFSGVAGPYLSPLLFLGTSIAIAFLYLRLAARPQWVSLSIIKVPAIAITAAQWALFAGISYLVISKLKFLWWYHLMYHYPEGSSDIIPQIQTLAQRFLAGEQPYHGIQFTGYVLYPTYMPFQWLPYIPLELLHKDYRWLPAIAMLGASFYYFISKRKMEGNILLQLLVPVWPMLVWCVSILYDNNTFIFTVEGLIAAYYLFVAESIGKKNLLPLAIGIGLCLFSRYSIVFWVPLCLSLFYIAGEKKKAFLLAGTALLFFVVSYWWPFLRHDANIFINGYNYHTQAALDEWVRDKANNGHNYLNNGLGFTSYAVSWFPGDLEHQLAIYKNVLFGICLLTVALLGFYYYRARNRYSLQTYMLFSFKIYIAVFYAFIQIPYRYLYLTPLVVSAALLGGAFFPRPVKDNTILE